MDFIINNGVLEKYTGDYENVTEIVVPNGVKTIGYKSFKRCINLVYRNEQLSLFNFNGKTTSCPFQLSK